MILDDRLEAVAGFVPAGCKVADIGTDHGYLAMELYKRDERRTVIAADTVCIAGMGGKLISDILSAEPEVLAGLNCLVLQPQNAYSLLRKWLYEHNWHIVDEALAQVDGRVYQIIKAERGQTEIPSELALKLGPVLLDKRPELFANHVENNLISCHKVLTGLQKSAEPDRGRIQQVEAEIAELEGLL